MFTVVTRPNCGYCVNAKELLTEKGLEFQTVELTEGMFPLFKAFGLRTVPQIWDGMVYIGGYTDLVPYLVKE